MAIRKDLYAELSELSKEIALFSSIKNVLRWDQETYLPKGGIAFRSSQIAKMASHIHKLQTGSRFSKALDNLIDLETGEIFDAELSEAQIAALREWRRDYLRVIKLPSSFVRTVSKITSQASHAWSIAKRKNAFKEFSPHLEKIISLCRKKADLLGFQEHPYDALLDLYEPTMTTSYLTPLFAKLKLSLTSLLKSIATKPAFPKQFLQGHFSPSHQMAFVKKILQTMGFDENTSRLDLSSHPMCCTVYPKDTRLTTRIHPENPLSNIFSVLHEGGHGLYSLGRSEQYFGSPLCESVSLGIDESQSRFWETFIGHSLPFWQHFYPLLQEEFPENLSAVPLNAFFLAINSVKPSLIRIEADEVTYSLHIIVRFEIEKALIEGSLKVKEIPECWNEKMREYLGITAPDNAVGCLQDIHWAIGAFGYFPTYALGNLYAAQFAQVFQKAHSDWKEKIARGELGFIREWLHQNIYQYGRQYTPHELILRITGKPLSEHAYIDYLENKFHSLYQINNK